MDKLTSAIIPFGKDVDILPGVERSWRERGPLDLHSAIAFEHIFDDGQTVYYHSRTDRTMISTNSERIYHELSQVFEVPIWMVYDDPEYDRYSWKFLVSMIIGDALVYRVLEYIIVCEPDPVGLYKCRALPCNEISRYVFRGDKVICENPDGYCEEVSLDGVEALDTGERNDEFLEVPETYWRNQIDEFKRLVQITNKDLMVRAMRSGWIRNPFRLHTFLAIYKRCMSHRGIDSTVPERIVKEIHSRNHQPNVAVKIERDLAVVTWGRKCLGFPWKETVRAYFDAEDAYFFKQNYVTGEWESWDIYEDGIGDWDFKHKLVDRDVFKNTSAERIAERADDERFPGGVRINLASLIVQIGYLAAEQAAKTNKRIYDRVFDSAYDEGPWDRDKSLPEVLGITGGQLKFLADIRIPEKLSDFGETMKDDDFIRHFPDVKKRIFAVAFYLNGRKRRWRDDSQFVSKKDVFAVEQTICSIERCDVEIREHLANEYRDYLIMHRSYDAYLQRMTPEDPLREEILAFGEMPINMKPSKIRDYHRKIGQIIDLTQCTDKIKLYNSAIHERKVNEAKEVEYSDGRYSIIMPDDARDIINEGRVLNHCVGRAGYIEAMAQNITRILFLRENKGIKAPLLTIEERNGAIRQCYGYGDSINKDPDIRDFIMEYAEKRHLKVEACIYK